MEVKLKFLILFIAIMAEFTQSLDEVTCDFSKWEGSLSDSHVSLCLRRFNKDTQLQIICPKEVKGEIDKSKRLEDAFQIKLLDIEQEYEEFINHLRENEVDYSVVEEDAEEYSIYPINADETVGTIMVDDLLMKTSIRNMGVFDVFGTKGENILSRTITDKEEIVTIRPPSDGLLTVKNHYIMIYLCAKPKYMVKCDSKFLNLILNTGHFPNIQDYLKLRVPILGTGDPNIRMGIAIVYLTDLRILQHGCGSTPTKFFTNAAEYDSLNGVVHCKVDVMTNPNVGFYCEGTIEPYNCPQFLINYEDPTKIIYVGNNTLHREMYIPQKIVYANYLPENIYDKFKGYCECRNNSGRVVAKIIIERKNEHICNIPSLLVKDRLKKIPDEWCKVTLHPGDTLNIIVPVNIDNIIIENMKKNKLEERRKVLKNRIDSNEGSSKSGSEEDNKKEDGDSEGKIEEVGLFMNKVGLIDYEMAEVDLNGEDHDVYEQMIIEEQNDLLNLGERIKELEEQIVLDDEEYMDKLETFKELNKNENEGDNGNEGDNNEIEENINDEPQPSTSKVEVPETDDDNSDSVADYTDTSDIMSESGSEDFAFYDGIIGFGETEYLSLSSPEINYSFVTTFSPKNPKTEINCFSSYQQMICQMPMDNIFAGDAYQVDNSNINKGIVKIEYKNKPLASKNNTTSMNYYWVLKYRGETKPDIIAKITVKLTQTHPYSFGCETKQTGIFFPQYDSYYCMYNFNGCKKRKVKHFVYDMTLLSHYGISCNDDETMYPNDEDYYMIESKTDDKAEVSRYIDTIIYPSLSKFKLFKRKEDRDRVYSYRCGCIDKYGFETSRLTLYHTKYIQPLSEFRFDPNKYIQMIPIVPMFLPKFERTKTLDNRRSDLNNSIPETEFIPLYNSNNITRYDIKVIEGSSCRLSTIKPMPLFQSTVVNIKTTMPQQLKYEYTLEGVRHNKPVNRSRRYNDSSLSPQRLFPANLTRYFYKRIEAESEYLVPVEYSSILATNVGGLKIEVKNLMGTDVKNYEYLYITLPVGSIVIIKDDTRDYIEMIYASGAISKPTVNMIEEEEKEIRKQILEKLKEKTRKKESIDKIEEPQPSTSKGVSRFIRMNINKKEDKNKDEKSNDQKLRKKEIKGKEDIINEKYEESDDEEEEYIKIKYINQQKREYRKKEKLEMKEFDNRKGNEDIEYMDTYDKEPLRDIRRMEILGLYVIHLEATNPWVHGCGVTDEGEDFFKPDTEKIIEEGKVVGCRVKITRNKIAGFYCPEPYVTEPKKCFDEIDQEVKVNGIIYKRNYIERIEHENKAFTYVRYNGGNIKDYIILFSKKKVLICYCKTIYGNEVSRIEIII